MSLLEQSALCVSSTGQAERSHCWSLLLDPQAEEAPVAIVDAAPDAYGAPAPAPPVEDAPINVRGCRAETRQHTTECRKQWLCSSNCMNLCFGTETL